MNNREQFLSDHGAMEEDVMIDADGVEYIMNEVESGTPSEGDDYKISHIKLEVPR